MSNNLSELFKYKMDIIFLVDTSESMRGKKIEQINTFMATAVVLVEEIALEKEIRMPMRVIEFNTSAKWVFGTAEEGVEHIDWEPLQASGRTQTDEAIDLAREVMHISILGQRNYRPVVILITDGLSNEPHKTIEAVARLKASLRSSSDPSKDKITRIAIGVTGANQTELINFASKGNIAHADGTVEENVSLVFDSGDIETLAGILKSRVFGTVVPPIGIDEVTVAIIGDDDWDD